jgi:Carboxypeptidase regulatory-like domain
MPVRRLTDGSDSDVEDSDNEDTMKHRLPDFRRGLLALSAALLIGLPTGAAFAQTMPTGTLTGRVTDPSGLALPGATVTVTSPALQGSRNAVTSANGDYALPFLPPGEYSVVVNETVRGTARDLFIEDSIEETKTSTSGISAEFGRFSGGVVSTITKSGGNSMGGSFRSTMNNEKWRAQTPFEAGLASDPRVAKVTPTYEATLGAGTRTGFQEAAR